MHHNDHRRGQSEVANFQQWLTVHSPHLLTGLIKWLCAILLPKSERGEVYHLPVVDCVGERLLELDVLMWVLSSVLPTLFLGAVPTLVAGKEVGIRY